MKSKLFLRLSSGLIFFHTAAHTYGHSTWKQASDPVKQEVIKQMTEYEFPFMGTLRSMGAYYDGYGYASTIALLLIAMLLWVVSGAIPQYQGLVKKIVLIISIALFAWGIDELVFFFPFAASITLLAGIFSSVSFFMLPED
jgi:hypothetical protein